MKRAKRIIIIISLSFNALVLLLLIGAGVKWTYEYHFGIGKHIAHFGEEKMRHIRHDQMVRAEKKRFIEVAENFRDFLEQEPFNRLEAKKYFNQLEQQLVKINQVIVDQHLLDYLSDLPPDDRVRFVGMFIKIMKKERGRDRRGGGRKYDHD